MAGEEMRCSTKEKEMPKLTGHILQKQGKISRRKTYLGGENIRLIAWILKNKKKKNW